MTRVGASEPKRLPLKEQLASTPLTAEDFPEPVRKSIAIHNQTIAAANSFHVLFCERHKIGRTADDHYEQDLLRAMILFSCSGLDATIKQLVRDSLECVIAKDLGAQAQFSKFIERRLKRGSATDGDRLEGPQSSLDFGLLAHILANPQPRIALINTLITSLTSDSLQSRDQILKVAAHFALTRDDVIQADTDTKEAFNARNQLAHEMDIDFKDDHRRRDRSYTDMVRWSENILQISDVFITKISEKI